MVMDIAAVESIDRQRIRRQEQAAALFTARRPLEETHVLHRAEFHGTAREYFGIWVINTLFTLLTLGLYAPWAKVRRNRYFHANTTLGGFAFDYHATGGQLLKGWLLVAAYLIGYNLIVDAYPLASLGVLVVMLGIFPWLIERALRFKAKVTSYRNLRFHFHGKLSEAYISVLLGGSLGVFSIGLLAPIFSRIYYGYMFDGVSYGGRRFHTTGRTGAIYKTIWLPAIVLVLGLLPATVLMGHAMTYEYQVMPNEVLRSEWWRVIFHALFSAVAIIPFLLAYYLMLVIYRTGVRNVMWSAATFDGKHRLLSDIPRMRYAWILISNTVVTILSLGLLRPWAALREHRFLVAFTGIWITGDIEELHAEFETSGSAFGSEFMDSDGFDLGF
jgi:uncharacterized membrane protein YjgN (DUF898 family)